MTLRRAAVAFSPLVSALILIVAVPAIAADALPAATNYVDDAAQVFKPATAAATNARDAQLQTRTGKAVTVITVKSTNGTPLQTAAAAAARARSLNGALIYIARDDKQLSISYAANTVGLFPPALQTSIKQALQSSFRAGNFDDGIITAVDSISGVIVGGPSGGHGPQMQPVTPRQGQPSGPFGIGWLWWVMIAIVVIFIARGLAQRPATPPGAAGGDSGGSR
jgi:uncharacterized protein